MINFFIQRSMRRSLSVAWMSLYSLENEYFIVPWTCKFEVTTTLLLVRRAAATMPVAVTANVLLHKIIKALQASLAEKTARRTLRTYITHAREAGVDLVFDGGVPDLEVVN